MSSTCPDRIQDLENKEALHWIVVDPGEEVACVQPHVLRTPGNQLNFCVTASMCELLREF